MQSAWEKRLCHYSAKSHHYSQNICQHNLQGPIYLSTVVN